MSSFKTQINAALQSFVSQLGGVFSNVSPFAHVIVGPIAALVAAGINSAFSGTVDAATYYTLGAGLASALVGYFLQPGAVTLINKIVTGGNPASESGVPSAAPVAPAPAATTTTASSTGATGPAAPAA